MLTHVIRWPLLHTLRKPMQADRAPETQQMPLPRGKCHLGRIAAAVRIGEQYMGPPERRRAQSRLIDSR